MSENLLWYEEPARQWTDALPLGNGRLGAMVFGGTENEHYQINEDTLWSGGPYRPTNPDALAAWPRARELVFENRFAEAENLIDRSMMAIPVKQMSFQPACDLTIRTSHQTGISNYRRELDIARALSTITYDCNDTHFRRESFISVPDQVLAIRFTSNGPAPLTLQLALTSDQPGTLSVDLANALLFTGNNREAHGIAGALHFAAQVEVIAKTIVPNPDRTLTVSDASEIVLLLDVATSFVGFEDVSADPLARLGDRQAARRDRTWAQMLTDHCADYSKLFSRLSIELGTTEAAKKPTVDRVRDFATTNDPALAALYVQFGRYLMLASSRPGTQPATLQGIWNDQIKPPWDSKYTTNINLQMNYWLPDQANLPECFEPLIALVEDLSITGAEMAAAHYGARGWVLHHNTDLWRATGPIDGARWGMWPTGGAWLCVQLWDHASFAGFDAALVRRLYPLIKGAARFILDFMVKDPATGHLVTCPSTSPENEHPEGSTICAGPAMDIQIIRDLFAAATDAATRLDQDPDLVAEMQLATSQFPPDRIGENGQLQEWREDWDLQAPEPHHRHVSHLYGLYPGTQFNKDDTPDLTAAARRSLEIRGDDATGWGIGWRINLWARLLEGDHAHDVLALLLSPERTYTNLFDAHPPFQIDGNFGGAAGIVEMLVQSQCGTIRLLPACPPSWKTGALKGVRARGGITLDFAWRDATVTSCTLKSASDQPLRLFANGSWHDLALTKGETVRTLA